MEQKYQPKEIIEMMEKVDHYFTTTSPEQIKKDMEEIDQMSFSGPIAKSYFHQFYRKKLEDEVEKKWQGMFNFICSVAAICLMSSWVGDFFSNIEINWIVTITLSLIGIFYLDKAYSKVK